MFAPRFLYRASGRDSGVDAALDFSSVQSTKNLTEMDSKEARSESSYCIDQAVFFSL
jgi:hypothetical protein